MTDVLQGIGASPGIAMGPVRLIRAEERPERLAIGAEQAAAEQERLDRAVKAAAAELAGLCRELQERGQAHEAEIFEGHLLFLEDEELIGSARQRIATELIRAEPAVHEAAEETAGLLEQLDDPYLRERGADIRDVGRRVIRLLARDGREGVQPLAGAEGREAGVEAEAEAEIWIADDLSPSDTARLDRRTTAGFATAAGGRTSHSAILARSLGIPAMVGGGSALLGLENGVYAILDGAEGRLLVNPTAEEKEHYAKKAAGLSSHAQQYEAFRGRESLTADGVQVELVANIGSPQEAEAAARSGAEGIGLFRTEFLYMGRSTLPSEEEQLEAYTAVVRAFGPEAPVVIRTLDIGGDKELPVLGLPKEDNPFLGFRAIRICLDRPDLFKTQLRAILRASSAGNIKIMFPMIATLAEWRQAKALLEEAKEELRREGKPFREELETGIMIEVPAAALMADRFAKEVDFFSIGTNDLTQYVMAADRMNPKLAHLSDPLHPAVLRLIHTVIRAASREGKWTGMCGEMAGQPLAVPLLLGMGLSEFSMSGSAVLRTRALLAQLNVPAAQELAAAVLELDDPAAVRACVLERLPGLAGYMAGA